MSGEIPAAVLVFGAAPTGACAEEPLNIRAGWAVVPAS